MSVIDFAPPAHRALSEKEARALTAEIKRQTVQLWLLVEQAHEGRAWDALGYDSWKSYVTAELQMSESRSFQLIDQAKVMRELGRAGVDLDDLAPPPARVVAIVKNALPEVRKAAARAIREGTPIDQAMRTVALENRPKLSISAAAPAQPLEACPACDGAGKVTRRKANKVMRALGLA